MSLLEWWLNFLFALFLYLFALDFISDGGFELGHYLMLKHYLYHGLKVALHSLFVAKKSLFVLGYM